MSKPTSFKWVKKAGCIGAVTVVVLFLLLYIAVVGPIPFQFLGLLLFGWIGFLSRVLPEITFNVEIAVNAVIASALALYGLHRILCWWAAREEGARAWRFAWTVKISLMVLLLFATSIAAVGIVHQVAWLCREPNIIINLGRGVATKELSHLKQVGTACRLYAVDNGGRYPKQLHELAPDYLPDTEILFTSARTGDPPQLFLYFAGYKDNDDPTLILLASPRPFESERGRTRAIVCVDTSGQVIEESKYQELIGKQRPPGQEK